MIILEDLNAVDIVVPISEDANYLVDVPAATTMTVSITMKEKVIGTLSNGISVTFADTGPDTITRTQGSWLDDGFDDGMVLTVTGTTSNNTTYTIATVDDLTITLVGGDTIVAESGAATIIGNIPTTDWFVSETVLAGTHSFKVFEISPTAFKFKRASGTGVCRVWVRT